MKNNILSILREVTGLKPYEFAKAVEKDPNHITRNIRSGGDLKTSTLKDFADKTNLKVKIEISNGNSRVKFEL